MEELRTSEEVARATGDLLIRWAAQALAPGYPHQGGRAWVHGDAVAVFAPGLSRADRLAFTGTADDAAELVSRALEQVQAPKMRPVAATALAHQVANRLGLEVRATFGWMELQTVPTSPVSGVEWLSPSDEAEVAQLLRKANPSSYLFPGDPGAHRWAGIRSEDGVLAAVGADSWPAPGVRFISGVATHPDFRGEGLATRLCAFLSQELAREGAVTLMVDADNVAALRVYRKLGFSYHTITALAG
ncbi:GNAT family N-acetyltransferase [Saccharopolyspora rectivirgula]|jgi:ribosomal protein S18 acetylase RimI-like enzyme|uniref:N-acetyltransferase domain-containing protein n=1 Tax=Saccharopolyspora rectivirgula TaxID=28042 RepID=A0A073B1R2_9PSEU|nr:GNAT family N-acetyltransferase [Saccharopolyspora rectivirgula]KEI45491.1 hypothetical protein GU90_03340 [Saccharopolyspora rectivirgula]